MLRAAELRTQIQARRRALSPADLETAGEKLAKRFLASTPIESGLRIGLYHSLPFEISLDRLGTELRRLGARTFYPRVSSPQTLEFAEAGTSWIRGAFGILEPSPESPNIPCTDLQMILVPGVAFGPQGERIGLGQGFYDRFLARVPSALRVVLALDFQLVDEPIEQNPWDQPMDWILTETREIRTPRLESRKQ